MKVCVIGSGYVGLVAGACFADTGNTVYCADIDEKKIEGLNRHVLPIYEPGLEELVVRNHNAGRLIFTTDVGDSIRRSEVVFIAVGTPPGEDGSADLKYVLKVAETIGKNLNGFKVVVNKSTVPVGTADLVTDAIHAHTNEEFEVVSNPEFLKEGAAIKDFQYPDRVVVGTSHPRARDVMSQLYAPFTRTNAPLLFMDKRSAEMTKYAANSMLAARISFMNEIARLCERVGADIEAVRIGIGTDARIGNKFLFAGAGFGGSCFPKDVRALLETGRKNGEDMPILRSVLDVNERQKMRLVERAVEHFGDDLNGRVFAVWGLAFKPETDDMREAPSITIIEELLRRGAKVRANDPVAFHTAHAVLGDRIEYVEDQYAAAEGADALFVVTEWGVYRNPEFERLRTLLRRPVVFDGRNLYNPARMADLGFVHFPIGRPIAGR